VAGKNRWTCYVVMIQYNIVMKMEGLIVSKENSGKNIRSKENGERKKKAGRRVLMKEYTT